MQQVPPSRAIVTFDFSEEPILNEYRREPGSYLIEDTNLLSHIYWEGADLLFIEKGTEKRQPGVTITWKSMAILRYPMRYQELFRENIKSFSEQKGITPPML